jgi:type IX secretion system PorP/SprF family membrane protein
MHINLLKYKELYQLVIISLMFTIHLKCDAQVDMLTNQYVFQDFQLNPAKIIKDKNSLNFYYRHQWMQFNNSPKLYSLSSNFRILDNFYTGVIVNKTEFGGSYSSYMTQLSAAYRINLGEENHSITIGEGIKLTQLTSNYSKLILSDQSDPQFPLSPARGYFTDFTAGVFYRNKFFKSGVAVNSILGITDESKSLPYNSSINADIGILIKHKDRDYSEIDQSTQINFRGRLNQFNNLQLEAIFDCYATSSFSFGAGYRHDINQAYPKFYGGNSLLAHITIRISNLSPEKKIVFAFGTESNAFNQRLDVANNGTYEGVIAFEKYNKRKKR